MALTPIYQLKTFSDLYTAVREELKIQSTDTTALNRIKRDVNIVYLEEVVPYYHWKWLRGVLDATVYAAISTGTAHVTTGSVSVTLTNAIASPKQGWLFGVIGYSEVYRIAQHTANSTTITLQVPFTGTSSGTAQYKIWTDEIYLPSFVRDTFEVTHDFQDQPLENCGLQKFRQYVASLPRAEGRPSFYTTNTYSDPQDYQFQSGIPAVASRSSNTIIKTLTFASDVSNYLQQGDRIEVSNCTDPSYNGRFVVATQSGSTITFSAMVPTYESTTTETAALVAKLQPANDSRRAKRVLVYPAIYQQNTTLHIDYVREVSPLADDSDEPLMPIGDRTVILYGALHRAWSRERNPEEAKRNSDLYEKKLLRMAGKIDDSIDQPKLVPSRIYLGSKRMAQRQKDTRNGLPEGWGGGTSAGGNVITNTGNRVAVFDSTGTLNVSIVLASSELTQLSGIKSLADGISDTNTLTNKTINITSNNIQGASASVVAIFNSGSILAQSTLASSQLTFLSSVGSNLAGISDVAVLTNKTISSTSNTITGIADSNISSTGLTNVSISSSAAIARFKLVPSSANAVVVNDANGYMIGVAPGSNGNILTSNGTSWSSQALTVTTANNQSANYVLTTSDDTVFVTTGASTLTATLPTASGVSGKQYRISKVDTGNGVVNVLPFPGQTIGKYSSSALFLSLQDESITVESDNSNWQILTRKNVSDWKTFSMVVSGSGGTSPTVGATTVNLAAWRKVGENMEIRLDLSSTGGGTAGIGNYWYNSPLTRFTFDSTIVTQGNTTSGVCGFGFAASGSNNGIAFTYPANSTALGVNFYNSALNSASVTNLSAGSTPYTAATIVSFQASVPVTNWS